jgi:catalase
MSEIASAIETITAIQVAMIRASDAPHRGQHAKMNGCLNATFEIRPDIPQALKVGLFSAVQNFDVVIRFSNGSQTDDRKPDIHGMAMKLLNVPGKKVLDAEAHATEQDFVLADNPRFFIRDANDYVLFMQDFVSSAPLGKPPERFISHLKEHHPEDIPVLLQFRQQVQHDPLTSTYWSQVPYAFGSREGTVCRYRSSPLEGTVGSATAGLSPDYLRERMIERLAPGRDEVRFDFAVQVKTHADESVIDNPTVEWAEPFISLATIHIPSQIFDTVTQDQFGDNLSFSPWHALLEHRPIGEINEIRKAVYLASQALRQAPPP